MGIAVWRFHILYDYYKSLGYVFCIYIQNVKSSDGYTHVFGVPDSTMLHATSPEVVFSCKSKMAAPNRIYFYLSLGMIQKQHFLIRCYPINDADVICCLTISHFVYIYIYGYSRWNFVISCTWTWDKLGVILPSGYRYRCPYDLEGYSRLQGHNRCREII